MQKSPNCLLWHETHHLHAEKDGLIMPSHLKDLIIWLLLLLLADGIQIDEWRRNICFYCGILITPSGRREPALCQLGSQSPAMTQIHVCTTELPPVLTEPPLIPPFPDLDHPDMYTYILNCSLEGLICIFIRKKRKQQIFSGASRESSTKSLSPHVGAIEQNIYFVFIPFLNCGLMCKSELPFQQGKSGFNTRPKIQLAQRGLSARISSVFIVLFCFLNKVSNTNSSLLCLAVVCPTYWTCSKEFCRAVQVKRWGRKWKLCPKRDQTGTTALSFLLI